MNRWTAIIVGAALLPVATAPAASAAGADWKQDPSLRQEVARAGSQNRRLLVKVSTAWCPACRQLDRVLARPEVRRALAAYVRLAYDAEVGEGEDVARRYNAITFPTLLVLGGDGLELDRLTGDFAAPALLAGLKAIEDGSGTVVRLEQQLARRPDDLALRLRVGRAWALKGRRVQAERHLARVVAGDPRNARGLAAAALLVQGKYLLLRSLKEHRAAAEVLRGLRRRFPAAPEAGQALYPLARALHGQGQTAAALALLVAPTRNAKAPGKQRAAAHYRVAWFCWYLEVATDKGLRHAEQAVQLDPKDAESWAALALLQGRAGKVSEARASWGRALALEPDNRWYKQNRAGLTRGP